MAQPAAAEHVKPLQSWAVTAPQLPLPSQYAAGVKDPPAQAAVPHEVVLPRSSHWPLPSQDPVLPQPVASTAQPPLGSFNPEPTGPQVPSGRETVRTFAQAMQAPLRASLQQMPEAQ